MTGTPEPSPANATSAERMTRALLWGTSAYCAIYLLQIGLQVTGYVYDPLARTAHFGHPPTGAQMRYFGDVLGACVTFALAAGLGLLLPLRAPVALGPLVGSTFALLALDLVFFFSRVLAAT